MGDRNQITATLTDDVYEDIIEEHNQTGKTKAEVAAERLEREYRMHSSLSDTIIPIFGQSLFVAGFIVSFLNGMFVGVGVALLGLGLMLGAKVDEYCKSHGVPAHVALIRVLGA